MTIFAISLAIGAMLGGYAVVLLSAPSPLKIIVMLLEVIPRPDPEAARKAAEEQFQVWRELVKEK